MKGGKPLLVLATESGRKDLGGQLAEQPALVALRQLLEDRVDRFPPGVAHGTEPVAGDGAGDGAREVGDDEAHRAAAEAADQGPELARRPRVLALGQPFVPEHLLEHAAKLLVAELLLLLVRRFAAAEPKRAPWEPAGTAARRGPWDLLVRVRGGVVAAAEVVGPGGVVVAAPRRVRERVVCVVDLLELFGARGAFGGVGGDAVRVGLQGRAFVGVADLLLGCIGGDGEDGIWAVRSVKCERSLTDVSGHTVIDWHVSHVGGWMPFDEAGRFWGISWMGT